MQRRTVLSSIAALLLSPFTRVSQQLQPVANNFCGCSWIITVKRDMVPTETVFMFADPKFIGKGIELDAETTLYHRTLSRHYPGDLECNEEHC